MLYFRKILILSVLSGLTAYGMQDSTKLSQEKLRPFSPEEVVEKYTSDPSSHYDELIEYARLVEGKNAEILKEILEQHIRGLKDQYQGLATVNSYVQGIMTFMFFANLLWIALIKKNLHAKELDSAYKEYEAAVNHVPTVTTAEGLQAIKANIQQLKSDFDQELVKTRQRIRPIARKIDYGLCFVLVSIPYSIDLLPMSILRH
jgi:sugar-specific transcriptional regulator TrmB